MNTKRVEQQIIHHRRKNWFRGTLWVTLLWCFVLGCSSKVVPGPESPSADLAEPPSEPLDLAESSS
jgi:hypothetical protein